MSVLTNGAVDRLASQARDSPALVSAPDTIHSGRKRGSYGEISGVSRHILKRGGHLTKLEKELVVKRLFFWPPINNNENA